MEYKGPTWYCLKDSCLQKFKVLCSAILSLAGTVPTRRARFAKLLTISRTIKATKGSTQPCAKYAKYHFLPTFTKVSKLRITPFLAARLIRPLKKACESLARLSFSTYLPFSLSNQTEACVWWTISHSFHNRRNHESRTASTLLQSHPSCYPIFIFLRVGDD